MGQKRKTFEHKGRTYRIAGITRREYEYGYSEPSLERYNVLQVRLTNPVSILLNLSRWKTIELEHVPPHAWISQATLGDTGGWNSALIERCRAHMGMA